MGDGGAAGNGELMPNNRQPHKPPMDRTVATYQMCIVAGVLLRVVDGELVFDHPDKVSPTLRRQVEAHKAALIEYIAKLPPKSWSDVGRPDDFEEVGELSF